ncbi:MAG: RnfH family protein [Steroidobacteraceae bacterium]
MAEPDWIEVVYADPDRQVVRRLPFEAGLTAAAAVQRARMPGVAATDDGVAPDLGVWGRPVAPGQVLSPGDRVEVYRPLRFDPREERRRRAGVSRRRGAS